MTETEKMNKKHLEDVERIKNFRLLDDDFMTQCFSGDTAGIELVLRIILEKPDLKVVDVRTQVFVGNLLNRSVRLDVVATDSQNTTYDIEIQREAKGAGKKRARYNSSMLDAKLLQKSEDFDKLPESYVIFITETDVMGKGKPLYHIGRYIFDTAERFDDGSHILYVNGAYRAENEIGRLMEDFACTNPDNMHYAVLAERVRYFKESKEGVAVMCEAMEKMWNDAVNEGIKHGLKEGRKEEANAVAKRMIAAGLLSDEAIAEYSGLTLKEVKQLRTEQSA